MAAGSARIPEIDVAPLVARGPGRERAARAIGDACRDHGFFSVVGHGIETRLVATLEERARAFFALDASEKAAVGMERGGRAWRGYFPVGREKTLGLPDQKEGLYFGDELGPEDPRVRAALPLHGANLFPAEPELRPIVLEYLAAATALGHALAEGLALGLGLAPSFFSERFTAEPLVLFRIFHYPPLATTGEERWSVGEHTDYGFLTILWQDAAGGLQVRVGEDWVDVPPRADAFVCNIGDMLDRMTGGRYRSTLHRVRNPCEGGRLSLAFFFDPGFEARIFPIPLPDDAAPAPAADAAARWDGVDPHLFEGTYGEYLLRKVKRVFPELARAVL